MSYGGRVNPSHTWIEGAIILGAKLSTCSGCPTLRVEEAGAVHFIRPREDDARIVTSAPPCAAPAVKFRAPW